MKNILYSFIGTLTFLMVSCSKTKVTPTKINPGDSTGGNPNPTVSAYLTNAKATHSYITNFYLTPSGGYRVNTTTNTNGAFEWYNASQLYADAEMVSLGDATYLPYMNNTFNWLNH
ncbi:MAG: hypothetical protein JWP37_4206, partial [Mucilaginibacter sp.]|nr:hypothetical protein [Mucilaginibacter sp.]